MEIGLLVLRLVLGSVMIAHGAQKLFGWFGGYGIAGTGGWLASMGFRPARGQAVLVGLSEFGGGLLLALGLLTPLGAAAVIGVMIVAIATVHWTNGFFNTSGGYEFNYLILGTALALALMGPGKLSVDHALGLGLNGLNWGTGALALALIGSSVTLASRRPQPQPAAAETAEEEEHARAA
ncbi:MAG TPA: DoxX family protein [Actinomycetota bacterium]|nr:DoxX family protein [Actinomycetota bacterium]